MKDKFSFFSAPIRNVVPSSEMTVHEVYEYVTSDVAKECTGVLRGLDDRKMQQQYKATKLDYVTPSAVVARRGSGGLIAHSGWVVMDIDHLVSEEELQRVKSLLVADEVLRPGLIFRSPSGDGLKVWYRLFEGQISYIRDIVDNCNPSVLWTAPLRQGSNMMEERVVEAHKYFYESIVEYLRRKYSIIADATSDVMRACYLCCDKDAYFNAQCTMHNAQLIDLTDSIADARAVRPYIGDGNMAENSQIADTRAVTPYIERTDWEMVEALVRGIEQVGVDITGDYHQWVKIGFALASAFGESGRGFYHRVSRFYHGYSNRDCNRQYDRCLKAGRGGVGLGTFVYFAKAV